MEFQPDEEASERELIERLRDLLVESVKLHEVSDVPIGAFLSGGIDSSAVVATMAAMRSEPVKTFSIGFADSGLRRAAACAERVPRRSAPNITSSSFDPMSSIWREDLAWFLDEPFGDTSAIPTYMVSKLAAEHVTVVLTGDGGDELFGGYDKYVTDQAEQRFDRIPRPVRLALGAVGRHCRKARRADAFSTPGAGGPEPVSRCLHAVPSGRAARSCSRTMRTSRWRHTIRGRTRWRASIGPGSIGSRRFNTAT